MIDAFCRWLYGTPFADAIRTDALLFPWMESIHVLAVAVVFGSILVVDLRLLDVASRGRPAVQLMREVLPLTWMAFGVAVLTGAALFSSNAVKYAHNFSFQIKMLLIALAGVNMLLFHFFCRGIGNSSGAVAMPFAARAAGAFSVALWLAIVIFGRWIGFTMGS